MFKGPTTKVVATLMALALLGPACTSRDDDDNGDTATGGNGDGGESSIDTADCIADPTEEVGDTIKLVSSFPQSGLTAAFSEIARGWQAYFDKVNEEGGVDFAGQTVTIEYEDADDEYNPAQTVENITELVGQDGENAFAAFSVVGTANNLAIREPLDELCVPNVFAATGSPAWGDPENPWLIGSTLSPYPLEAYMFADLLEQENPDATIAMLVQDDDFGDNYEQGLRQAVEGTDLEIVQVERYQTGANDVSAQITSLAATEAEAFFNGGTLLACPDALTRASQAGWEPITWVSGTCASKTLMEIADTNTNGAGTEGVYTAANIMDPLNPEWDQDPAMTEYIETVQQYKPEFKGREFDPQNAIVGYGYTQAALFVEALEAAESPTRLGLMESLHNLDGISDVGLLLPGVSVTTDGEDQFMGETLQLAQYDYLGPEERNHFVPQGELSDFEGQTTELVPEEQITAGD